MNRFSRNGYIGRANNRPAIPQKYLNETMRRTVTCFFLITLFTAGELPAQCDQTPPTTNRPMIVRKDLFYAGGFLAATVAMAPLDRYSAEHLQDSTVQAMRTLRNGADVFRFLGFPGPIVLGTAAYGIGRLTGHDCVADIGLHAVEAVVIAGVITQGGKSIFGRARPRVNTRDPFDLKFGRGFRGGGDYVSFPSGHTASAFAAATVITNEVTRLEPEYGLPVTLVMYGGATLVAASRMYNNQHWLSDVVAGAAIGYFSGNKVVLYNHGRPRNAVDRLLLGVNAAPNLDGGVTVAFTTRF